MSTSLNAAKDQNKNCSTITFLHEEKYINVFIVNINYVIMSCLSPYVKLYKDIQMFTQSLFESNLIEISRQIDINEITKNKMCNDVIKFQ